MTNKFSFVEDAFKPLGLFFCFIGIAQYNHVIGAISGTAVCVYTIIKIYKEFKKK